MPIKAFVNVISNFVNVGNEWEQEGGCKTDRSGSDSVVILVICSFVLFHAPTVLLSKRECLSLAQTCWEVKLPLGLLPLSLIRTPSPSIQGNLQGSSSAAEQRRWGLSPGGVHTQTPVLQLSGVCYLRPRCWSSEVPVEYSSHIHTAHRRIWACAGSSSGLECKKKC